MKIFKISPFFGVLSFVVDCICYYVGTCSECQSNISLGRNDQRNDTIMQ